MLFEHDEASKKLSLKDMKPVIVGVTASDINPELIEEAKKTGFHTLFQTPLTSHQVQN